MSPCRFFVYLLMFLTVTSLSGCGASESADAEHEESSSGASFKPTKGVILTEETRKILELEIADVALEKLPQVVRFNIQVFGEAHRFTHADADHTSCDIHGSGFLPPERVVLVETKQPVKLLTATGEMIEGFVVAVQKTLAHGEAEIIVGVTSAGTKLKDGEFVAATITLPRGEEVTVIPKSALLRTSGGTFVYTVNGEAYYRTAVKTGSEADGKIEIVEGLFVGDQVVTTPVKTLWIIELRATKGGGHSH